MPDRPVHRARCAAQAQHKASCRVNLVHKQYEPCHAWIRPTVSCLGPARLTQPIWPRLGWAMERCGTSEQWLLRTRYDRAVPLRRPAPTVHAGPRAAAAPLALSSGRATAWWSTFSGARLGGNRELVAHRPLGWVGTMVRPIFPSRLRRSRVNKPWSLVVHSSFP